MHLAILERHEDLHPHQPRLLRLTLKKSDSKQGQSVIQWGAR